MAAHPGGDGAALLRGRVPHHQLLRPLVEVVQFHAGTVHLPERPQDYLAAGDVGFQLVQALAEPLHAPRRDPAEGVLLVELVLDHVVLVRDGRRDAAVDRGGVGVVVLSQEGVAFLLEDLQLLGDAGGGAVATADAAEDVLGLAGVGFGARRLRLTLRERGCKEQFQAGLLAEHLLDERDQFGLAAPLQGRVRVLDLGEVLREMAPVQKQGGDVLAGTSVPRGTGAVGLGDASGVERHSDVSGSVGAAREAGLEGAALPSCVEEGVTAELVLPCRETALADIVADGLVGDLGKVAHGRPSPVDGPPNVPRLF